MVQQTMTRDQLVKELRDSQDELLSKIEGLPADAFEKGCYENGWNARQVLAHIAGIEWTYPKLIEVAKSALEPQPEKPAEAQPSDPAQRTAKGGIGSYNDRMVEKYADASAADLVRMFKENRATTISAFESVDESLLGVPIKSAGGIRGPLGYVVNLVAVMHVRGHVQDIVNAASG
jgi:hypothetical protein